MKENIKILIIDDSSANLAYLKSLLQEQHYKVATVNNGKSALIKAKSQVFDLILLDFEMPIMNGIDVCKSIKKESSNINTPIIFLTANRSDDVLIEAFKAGASDFITKPFNPIELLARVRTHISLVKHIKELAIAKSYAESASKAKGEFLANMSHEIRTPMNGIISVIDFLTETELSPRQKELTGIIKTSSDNLLTIINDILDFSKIEAGQMELEYIKYQPQKEFISVIKPLIYKAKENDIELKIQFDKKTFPKQLIGDPLRINQIIINLVNNAIKFTNKGGVYIKIEYKNEENFKGLKFEIRDTGIGISKKNIDKLFKSFSQTDASSTRKYGGTGLGLSISKKLSALMGGEIGVESKLQKGSTFWFTIPNQKETGKTNSIITNTKAKELKTLNILVVDDNSINRKVAKMSLEKLNQNITLASNGKEAYFLYLKNAFDIILMDVHMPEMDGIETTIMIRKYEKTHKIHSPIPIVAMTAAAMKGDKEVFIKSGMNEYISKPFKLDDIKQILSKFSEA